MSEKHDQFCKQLGNKNVTNEGENIFSAAATERYESSYDYEIAKKSGNVEAIKAAEKRIADSKAFARGLDNKTVNDESNHVFAALNGLGRDE